MQYWDRIKAMMDKVLKREKESGSIPTAGERKSESAGRVNWRTGRIENRIDKLDEGDITELKAVYSAFST